MFGQFRPAPPPKGPWHAACNYPSIINAAETDTMNSTMTRIDRIMHVAIRARTTLRVAEMVLESEGWDVARAIRNILALAH